MAVEKRDMKTRIMNAIWEMLIVNKLSYSEITIAGICRRAKITRKSFYNHFASKEEATKKLIDSQMNKAADVFDEAMESAFSFEEKLHSIQDIIFASYREEFTNELLERLHSDAPEIMEEHNRKLDLLFGKIIKLIDEGKKSGKIKADVNSKIAVALLYTASVSLNTKRYASEEEVSSEEMMNQAFNIVLNGILEE